MEFFVLDRRIELIAYQIRRGYSDTNRRQIFIKSEYATCVLERNNMMLHILIKCL